MTAIPAILGCFRCNGDDHWADACDTLIPPQSKAEHARRIQQYVEWFWDHRIDAHMKRKLIEHENEMWKAKLKEEAKCTATARTTAPPPAPTAR